MNVQFLVRHFSEKVDLPVEPNDVKKLILSKGMDLVIRFIGTDLDTNKVRGYLSQWVKSAVVYGEDTNIADVYYSENQSNEWIRLVCCKELLHILDAPDIQTSKREDVMRLLDGMALSPEFENLSVHKEQHGMKVVVDKITILFALAILFPWKAREGLMPAYKEGRLTDADIARMVELPLRYVRLVLSDNWPGLYECMI